MRWLVLVALMLLLAGCTGGRNILAAGDCNSEPLDEPGEGDVTSAYWTCNLTGAAGHTVSLACEGPVMVGAEAEGESLPNGTIYLELELGDVMWNATLHPQRDSAEPGDEAWHYVEAGGRGHFKVATSTDFDGTFGFGWACFA